MKNHQSPEALWDDPERQAWTTYPYTFVVYNKDIFYINMWSFELCRFDAEADMIVAGSIDNTANTDIDVLADKDIGAAHFTISENFIYYETLEKKIYKTDLTGDNHEFIADGYAPIVLGNYLFYYNADGEMVCAAK
jgi:hypothetical protein